jgi:hypothetical protein
MAGFNVTPPVPQLTAAQLAQLGLAAFRPPNPMTMPGMPSMPTGQAPGFGIGEGAAMLSAGLGALKGGPVTPGMEPARTAGDADLGGYSKVGPGGMVDVGGGAMLPNPNAPDPSGGPMAWLRRQLGLPDPLTGR